MIPLQSIELVELSEGSAILIVGILGLLLFAAIQNDNLFALMMWGLSVVVMIFVYLFHIPAQFFWLSLLGVAILLVVGLSMRVTME